MPVTAELVYDLAELKSISIEVGDLGKEFASVSLGISKFSIELRCSFRRLSPKGKSGGSKKSGHQSSMQAFLKKRLVRGQNSNHQQSWGTL